MEISITWNICRVCLQEEEKNEDFVQQMHHIFNEDKKLPQHIYEISGIDMKPNDSLPEQICQTCLTMVNNALHFRKTCRASNTYLETILERTKSATTLFKEERSLEKYDDSIANNSFGSDGVEHEDKDIESANLKANKIEHFKKQKPKSQLLIKESKNIELIDFSLASPGAEITEPKENGNNNDVEDFGDNVSDNEEELEEIIEQSDEMVEQLFNSTLNGDVEKKTKARTSQLKKCYMSASSTKLESTAAEPEETIDISEETGIKQDEEFYYILKDVNNENNINSHEDDHQTLEGRDNHIVTDENIEFFAIEEANDEELLSLEPGMDDSQAQVSSTNEEIDFYEQNSNATTNLDAEYVVDDVTNEDSTSNISSQESYVGSMIVSKSSIKFTKSLKNLIKTPHPIIISARRNSKLEHKKASATSSTTGGSFPQVCVCDICGNHFTNRHLMNIHMKVHRQEKNHECELCFKRFITACNLQAHMRIHTGEKPFGCQYCGRRFSDRSSNLRHERTHTNEKPFQCDDCGKSFSLATTLQNHMKVHTGERSYRCEPCGKSFKLQHHLKTHQNTTLHKAVQLLGRADN